MVSEWLLNNAPVSGWSQTSSTVIPLNYTRMALSSAKASYSRAG